MKQWFLPGIVLAAVFVGTRVPALHLQFLDSDINLYGRYAAEHQAASLRGQSFYDVHRERVVEEMGRSTPTQAAGWKEYQVVEYPPLAITLMTVPTYLVEAPFDEEFPTTWQPRYARAYVWLMAGVDAVVLLLVVFLVRRLFAAETPIEQLERCLVYVLCTWPLYGVLYSRLDLGVAVLVMAGLALLVCRVHWSLALAVLALAVHFKLMPLILAPLWIIATLPASGLRGQWQRMVAGAAVRAVVFAGIGLAILVPYWIADGRAVLEFLTYHKDRGIEIESSWASLLLPGRLLGYDWTVYHSHGSVNIHSPWSPLAVAAAMPLMAVLVIAFTALFVAAVRQDTAEESTTATIGQRWPRLLVAFTLLILLVSIVSNKVYSTQYVLWVLPLVPLLDLRPRVRRIAYAATFVVCVLTMRIFPDCFVGEIVYVVGSYDGVPLFDGPTAHGVFLLLARNTLSVALTAALAVNLCRMQLRASVPFLDAARSVC